MTAAPKKRKWFQFSLRTMMLAPMLVGGIWLWSTWPERTARKFHRYLVEGNVEAAQFMMGLPSDPDLVCLWAAAKNGESQFVSPIIQPRSLADCLFSRGEFTMNADQQTQRIYFGSFVASRGSLRPSGNVKPNVLRVVRFKYLSAEVALERIRTEFQPNSPARIIVDSKSNSLIVQASQETNGTLSTLLNQLDQPANQPARATTDSP